MPQPDPQQRRRAVFRRLQRMVSARLGPPIAVPVDRHRQRIGCGRWKRGEWMRLLCVQAEPGGRSLQPWCVAGRTPESSGGTGEQPTYPPTLRAGATAGSGHRQAGLAIRLVGCQIQALRGVRTPSTRGSSYESVLGMPCVAMSAGLAADFLERRQQLSRPRGALRVQVQTSAFISAIGDGRQGKTVPSSASTRPSQGCFGPLPELFRIRQCRSDLVRGVTWSATFGRNGWLVATRSGQLLHGYLFEPEWSLRR